MAISGTESVVAQKLVAAIFFSWLLAQGIKLTKVSQKKSIRAFIFRGGGIVSSHSASISSLAAGVFLYQGLSLLFLAVAVFGLIVIRDVIFVRSWIAMVKPIKHSRFSEMEGHTLPEVLAGITIGIVVTLVVFLI
ncbi:divergent PAP2 family protein [Candidatus Woesearchaeota archaeon]|nr:divergent PAP2 family protein [Candidatus Woesearchaeota archaeon]